ncbi:hypothetical protein BFL28_05590 [Sphingomonas turrisvirgatae]|uniref:Nodulation protein Z (NodZ) n=2 Tax=Sphingomonas turrisvirgatae TaxID=1888892 RepID=A0A1E3LS50_9SPHN|nr:hypothetical protein BFL28_05590 [Sphingomonas turrisvirgatae]
MLSAVTGIALAELGGRAPVIDWRDGMYLPVGENLYPALFEDPVGIDPAQFDMREDVAPALWSGRLSEQPVNIISRNFPTKHRSPFIYRRLSIDLNGPDPAPPIGVFWSYLPKILRMRAKLQRNPRFRGKSIDAIMHDLLARYFTPNAEVRAEVERIFAGRKRPVIGVHIRFTDRKAPLPKIEAALRKLRSDMPNSDIFLATDSAEAQNYILARFDRVFAIEKQMATAGQALHFSQGGMTDALREAQNALIDMCALAQSDWLIHSRHSTFSVVASLIGGIPEAKQIDVDRHNAKVVVKRWFQAYA